MKNNGGHTFKTKEELNQEHEDILFRMAFMRIQDDKVKQLENEIVNIEGTLEAAEIEQILTELRPTILSSISRTITKDKRRRFLIQTMPKAGKIAAACLLIFLIGITTAMAVPAIREKVLEMFYSVQNKYTEISLQENGANSFDVPEAWEGGIFAQ